MWPKGSNYEGSLYIPKKEFGFLSWRRQAKEAENRG